MKSKNPFQKQRYHIISTKSKTEAKDLSDTEMVIGLESNDVYVAHVSET